MAANRHGNPGTFWQSRLILAHEKKNLLGDNKIDPRLPQPRAWPGPRGGTRSRESIELGFRSVQFHVRLPSTVNKTAARSGRPGRGRQCLQSWWIIIKVLYLPEALDVQLLEEEALVWVEEPTRSYDFAGHAEGPPSAALPLRRKFVGTAYLTKSLFGGRFNS